MMNINIMKEDDCTRKANKNWMLKFYDENTGMDDIFYFDTKKEMLEFTEKPGIRVTRMCHLEDVDKMELIAKENKDMTKKEAMISTDDLNNTNINYAIPVRTGGGCHMYYGLLTNGNYFFITDSWDYGYFLNESPKEYMWNDTFEEDIKDMIISELEYESDEFYSFYDDVLKWLINNGYKEFRNY